MEKNNGLKTTKEKIPTDHIRTEVLHVLPW